MAKFKEGDHIRNIYNGQRFLVIEVNTNTSSDGYYIIKGETYPHEDKKWMLFFDAEDEWRLIGNNNPYKSKVMTKEEKQLLLKDLCARLPYGVKFHYTKHPQSNIDQDCDGTAIGYYCNLIVSANDKDFCIDRCELYLRPISSMTEEEVDEFTQFDIYHNGEYVMPNYQAIDWLNAHHFDFRGLIEKGLAIEVTEENNPYINYDTTGSNMGSI